MRKPKAVDFDDLSWRVGELAKYVRMLIHDDEDSYGDSAALAILCKMNVLNLRYDLTENELSKLKERDIGKAEHSEETSE